MKLLPLFMAFIVFVTLCFAKSFTVIKPDGNKTNWYLGNGNVYLNNNLLAENVKDMGIYI